MADLSALQAAASIIGDKAANDMAQNLKKAGYSGPELERALMQQALSMILSHETSLSAPPKPGAKPDSWPTADTPTAGGVTITPPPGIQTQRPPGR